MVWDAWSVMVGEELIKSDGTGSLKFWSVPRGYETSLITGFTGWQPLEGVCMCVQGNNVAAVDAQNNLPSLSSSTSACEACSNGNNAVSSHQVCLVATVYAVRVFFVVELSWTIMQILVWQMVPNFCDPSQHWPLHSDDVLEMLRVYLSASASV